MSRVFGINKCCSLSKIDYFDATKQFPRDLMHVLYEGVLNSEIMLLLKKLIVDYELDLEAVNVKIGIMRSTREFTVPPKLRMGEVMDNRKLSSSLSIILSLILGKYYSIEDNPLDANFILLMKITSSLQCYSSTDQNLAVLQFDIINHNLAFKYLYPNSKGNTITPKLHSLLHFPSQIRLYGPPRYSRCFRYE